MNDYWFRINLDNKCKDLKIKETCKSKVNECVWRKGVSIEDVKNGKRRIPRKPSCAAKLNKASRQLSPNEIQDIISGTSDLDVNKIFQVYRDDQGVLRRSSGPISFPSSPRASPLQPPSSFQAPPPPPPPARVVLEEKLQEIPKLRIKPTFANIPSGVSGEISRYLPIESLIALKQTASVKTPMIKAAEEQSRLELEREAKRCAPISLNNLHCSSSYWAEQNDCRHYCNMSKEKIWKFFWEIVSLANDTTLAGKSQLTEILNRLSLADLDYLDYLYQILDHDLMLSKLKQYFGEQWTSRDKIINSGAEYVGKALANPGNIEYKSLPGNSKKIVPHILLKAMRTKSEFGPRSGYTEPYYIPLDPSLIPKVTADEKKNTEQLFSKLRDIRLEKNTTFENEKLWKAIFEDYSHIAELNRTMRDLVTLLPNKPTLRLRALQDLLKL